MKINEIYVSTRPDQINSTGSSPRLDQSAPAAAYGERGGTQEVFSSQSDQVNLSSTSREIRQYQEAARQLPDVRQDRVQEIKTMYEAGAYRVDAGKLANTLIRKGDQYSVMI